MALVQFENNTAPYLNADNLNNNFNYLENRDVDIYSTNELKTNKVDENGDFIYRKEIKQVITQAEVNTGTYSIDISDLQIKNFRGIFGWVLRTDSVNLDTIMLNSRIVNSYLSVFYRPANNTLQVRGSGDYFGNMTIIIEYTKNN